MQGVASVNLTRTLARGRSPVWRGPVERGRPCARTRISPWISHQTNKNISIAVRRSHTIRSALSVSALKPSQHLAPARSSQPSEHGAGTGARSTAAGRPRGQSGLEASIRHRSQIRCPHEAVQGESPSTPSRLRQANVKLARWPYPHSIHLLACRCSLHGRHDGVAELACAAEIPTK